MTDPTKLPPDQSPPLPPRGRRTWLMVLVGLAIVISGVIIGAGTTVLMLRSHLFAPPPPDAKMANAIAEDMRHRFGLTDEQARRVHDIMVRSMATIEVIHEEAQAKMRAEHERLRGEMKEVLSPEQFTQWSAHFDALRPPGFSPPGPGKGGPPGPRGKAGDSGPHDKAGPPGPRPEKGRPGDDRPASPQGSE